MRSRTQKLVFLSLLTSMAIVLSYFERFIPMPLNVPGMKLGLANVITLSSFYFFRKKEVFAIMLIRVLVTSLIVGTVMSLFYSLAGGVLSFAGMAILHQLFSKNISPIGISIVGAVLHNVGQLIVLAIMSGSVTVALSYGPVIMVTGVATGVFVGIASIYFIKSIPLKQLKV